MKHLFVVIIHIRNCQSLVTRILLGQTRKACGVTYAVKKNYEIFWEVCGGSGGSGYHIYGALFIALPRIWLHLFPPVPIFDIVDFSSPLPVVFLILGFPCKSVCSYSVLFLIAYSCSSVTKTPHQMAPTHQNLPQLRKVNNQGWTS